MRINMFHRGLMAGTALLIASCAQSPSKNINTEFNSVTIDKVFKDIKDDTPGCILGVIKDGALVFQKGYGLANLEHSIPITTDTVFRIASTSKQFTAMSTIILAEEGQISLDDNIRKYVPEMPDYGKIITIRNLINHTSGIRDFLTLFFLKGFKDQDYYTEVEFLEMLARQKELDFTPGEKMSYSNSGYILQSIIIQRVTGKTLAEYAKEKIFDPLKMKNTHFHNDIKHLVKNRAYGYWPDKKGGYNVGGTPQELIGDGGVFTTIADLALYDLDFYEGKVWRPAVKEQMITPGVLNDGSPAAFFPDIFYAGGLIIGKQRGLPYVRHAGQFAGFITDFIRFPEQKLSVTALCNGGDLDAVGFTGKVSDIFLESHYIEAKSSQEKETTEKQVNQKKISSETLNAISGKYYNSDLDVIYKIVKNGKTFDLLIGKRPTKITFEELNLPVFDLGDDVLGNEYIKIKIIRDKEGQVTALNFTDFSVVKNLYFERVNK
ncbi:serine hydrolase domain-containing protein [Paremcibacter congregatus]|uniref:Penicillin-binding protein n=1 Tax=Paremcibacter congregatus TaxID=2043170 RepID=A0A2G4YVW9_9PROT|nr:serine hydrolase domain-containing protein [Paremcibacter congregatus]PHZ86390.1 penicillin-binding protein [Paremcibacter congregatus]QDE28513.1 beta-lactamase family protein [Paremcibacter congregatus]